MKMRVRHLLSLVVLLMVSAVGSSQSVPRVPNIVRRDWYFRETLPAIRDWEDILARWEKTTPEAERTPVFPVPMNGDAVTWANPIPLTLLPDDDSKAQVRVHISRGGASLPALIERIAPDGKTERQTVAPGATVLGYKHPGGGGKDQWYHSYHRKFDRLTTFRPQPAPFALQLNAPFDFRLGANELPVMLRNVSDKPLTLTLRLRFLATKEERACGEKTVTLVASAAGTVRFPFELTAQGGGLLLLKIEGADTSYWLPLFTHVEDVAAVLKGVEQILADTPDAKAAAQLSSLRQRAESLRAGRDAPPLQTWRDVFEQASALRDELLLRRINFDTLLFIKRKPYFSEQPFMDAHHLFNRPGGGIYRLSPVRPDGKVTPVVDSMGEGVYRDVCLHWDAKKILFSFGNGNDKWDGKQSYHLYEIGVDGKGLRQLTFGPKNDCEPFYLPNGQIGFTSDRSEHFVMCGGDRHVANLFVMGEGNVRQLSFNVFNDFNPTVLPDGRILYSRWEYNERSVTSLHKLFTINPDGTQMSPYYGNATIRPNVVMFARPVPNSNKVMALFTAHHGQTHGPIGLIDVSKGMDGDAPITVLTPNVPITGEKAEDSKYGWFSDPMPLPVRSQPRSAGEWRVRSQPRSDSGVASENGTPLRSVPDYEPGATYLCSFTPTVLPWLERSWAIYVGDRHGNLALVYRDPEISCAEPVPLITRPRPHVLPPAKPNSDATDAEATVLLMNVYQNLPGVPRGTAKYLRILEDVPRKGVCTGGVVVTGATGIYTIKRIFGVVPIEPDGSAHFVVPANRNVYFEVLDENQREIQRMRSVVCLKPNERRTCVGCHESRATTPPNISFSAASRPPSRPTPLPWGTQTISFLRDVQPILNAKCVRCHAYGRWNNGVVLTDDLTDQFTISYQELLHYISTANAMRWDNPEDVYPRPPYTYGSKVSRLTRLLEAGHHGVELTRDEWQRLVTWIDANGVYYDRYESTYGDRHIFTGNVRKAMNDVYARRCARCHGQDDDGRSDTWWLSLNRRDVKQSRTLQAPLARSAGGWERCEEVVFANTDDADYKTLLASLTALRDQLAQRPREDLLSLQGTDAERQLVSLPAPPDVRSQTIHRRQDAPSMSLLQAEGWVYLSDLPWESARSGWTPDQDGLPRRDKDIENRIMRLGNRVYRKGIGTHAPSEIVYRLDGKYARFFALIGGAEANGTVIFQVFGDDKMLYESGVLRGLREVKQVDVSVAGVQRLRLVVTDAGDNYYADEANWADARLMKAQQEAATR